MPASNKKIFNDVLYKPIFIGTFLFAIVSPILFLSIDNKSFSNKNIIQSTTSKLNNNAGISVVSKISTAAIQKKVLLLVPYIDEVPTNTWTGSWKNACEEASITMVEKFYKGQKTIIKSEGIIFMQMLFNAEDNLYGSNANSDAKRSNYLVNNYTSFVGVIKTNPTIENIKNELKSGHPVIAFHDGFNLDNKDIPFLPTGSAYHSTVIVGYDDNQNVFIVNDPGDTTLGEDHLYGYDLYMNSLHDYNYLDKKADGPARVIFTFE